MAEREPYYSGIPPDELTPLPRNPIHVVLDNLRSAYNVGAIFRTADATAVAHIHLCGMSAHPPHKKIEKTSLGAAAYVPWTYYERTKDALHQLKENGVSTVAVEVSERAVPLNEFDWPRPVAVVFGNEVTGISAGIQSRCGAEVRIPMQGYKNSINVATACGIVLYDILGQWRLF